MARGPRPNPSHLNRVHGNPSGRKPPVNEPLPSGELTDPPDWLTPEQVLGWRYALQHAPAGLLKRIDRGILTIWTVAEDIHRQAAIGMNTEGVLLKAGNEPDAQRAVNPWHGILVRQAMIMQKAADHLGFSPAARPRLAGVQPPPLLAGLPKGKAKVPLREYLANAPTRGLMS